MRNLEAFSLFQENPHHCYADKMRGGRGRGREEKVRKRKGNRIE